MNASPVSRNTASGASGHRAAALNLAIVCGRADRKVRHWFDGRRALRKWIARVIRAVLDVIGNIVLAMMWFEIGGVNVLKRAVSATLRLCAFWRRSVISWVVLGGVELGN